MLQSKYELFKLFGKKLFLLLLAALFLLNLFLYINEQYTTNGYIIDSLEEYNKQKNYYSDLSFTKAQKELAENNKIYENISFLVMFQSIAAEGGGDVPQEYVDAVFNDPKAIEIYEKYQNDTEGYEREYQANRLLLEQVNYISGYDRYIDNIQKQADDMVTFSIFNKPNSFSYRNILKTPEDFSYLKGTELKLGVEQSLSSFMNFSVSDIFVIVLILLLCIYVFWNEKESGLNMLIKSCKNGRARTFGAKIFVSLLSSLFIAILFYGSIMLLSGIIYGYGDTSRFVQSMQLFEKCSILLTVKEFLIIYFFSKVFCCIFTVLLFVLIINLLNNINVIYITTAAIFGISYLATAFIPAMSYFNVVKYINPIAIFNVGEIISKYNNLNIFGYPFGRASSTIYTILIFAIIFFVISFIVFAKSQNKSISKGLFEEIIERIKYRFFKLRGSSNLFIFENYKLYISKKMAIVILMLLYLLNGQLIQKDISYSVEQQYYLGYMNILSGELTEEKEKYLVLEQQNFNTLYDREQTLHEQYKNGEISEGTYQYEKYLLEMDEKRRNVFSNIMDTYYSLKSLEESGEKVGFVNEITAQYLFFDKYRYIQNAVLVSVLMILFSSVVFGSEYKNNMINILNPTKKGKKSLFICKNLVLLLSSIIVLVLVYGIQYINLQKYYPINDLYVSLKCIEQFRFIDINISIVQAIILMHVLSLIATLAIVDITVLLCIHIKKQAQTIVAAIVITVLPILLELISITAMRGISTANPFLMYDSIMIQNGVKLTAINIFLLIIVLIVSVALSYRKFCNIGGRYEIKFK